MTVPPLPPNCNSWVIIRKASGKAVFETFDPLVVVALNPDTALAVPALTYLETFNRSILETRTA